MSYNTKDRDGLTFGIDFEKSWMSDHPLIYLKEDSLTVGTFNVLSRFASKIRKNSKFMTDAVNESYRNKLKQILNKSIDLLDEEQQQQYRSTDSGSNYKLFETKEPGDSPLKEFKKLLGKEVFGDDKTEAIQAMSVLFDYNEKLDQSNWKQFLKDVNYTQKIENIDTDLIKKCKTTKLKDLIEFFIDFIFETSAIGGFKFSLRDSSNQQISDQEVLNVFTDEDYEKKKIRFCEYQVNKYFSEDYEGDVLVAPEFDYPITDKVNFILLDNIGYHECGRLAQKEDSHIQETKNNYEIANKEFERKYMNNESKRGIEYDEKDLKKAIDSIKNIKTNLGSSPDHNFCKLVFYNKNKLNIINTKTFLLGYESKNENNVITIKGKPGLDVIVFKNNNDTNNFKIVFALHGDSTAHIKGDTIDKKEKNSYTYKKKIIETLQIKKIIHTYLNENFRDKNFEAYLVGDYNFPFWHGSMTGYKDIFSEITNYGDKEIELDFGSQKAQTNRFYSSNFGAMVKTRELNLANAQIEKVYYDRNYCTDYIGKIKFNNDININNDINNRPEFMKKRKQMFDNLTSKLRILPELENLAYPKFILYSQKEYNNVVSKALKKNIANKPLKLDGYNNRVNSRQKEKKRLENLRINNDINIPENFFTQDGGSIKKYKKSKRKTNKKKFRKSKNIRKSKNKRNFRNKRTFKNKYLKLTKKR